MTTGRYYQGKLIIEETCTNEFNLEGQAVVRTVRLLEDGTRIVEETPLHVAASAPSASYDIEQATASQSIPVVQATVVPDPKRTSTTNPTVSHVVANGSTTSPMVSVTGPAQPPATTAPQVIMVGGIRLPPQVMYHLGPDRRDVCCGCFSCGQACAYICLCIFIVIVILWLIGTFVPDEYLEDDYYN